MGVKEYISGGNIEGVINNVVAFNWLPFQTSAIFILKVFFYILFAFTLFYVWKIFKREYKAKAIVYIKKGGNIVDTKKDVAKVIPLDEQGKPKIKLFWLKKSAPLPDNKYKYKSGRSDLYHFYMDDSGMLHPCELGEVAEDKKMHLDPIPSDVKAWYRMELLAVANKLKKASFWKENINQILLMSTVVFLFLMFYFGFKSLTEIGLSVASQLGQVATACTIR